MRIRQILMMLVMVVGASTVVACGGSKKSDDTMANTGGTGGETKSLYDRLGGKDAITAVVEQFVANVAANPKINARFANANIPNLKAMLVDQICEATGGPCKYTGKSMKDSHTGMNITEDEFNALVGDLVSALDKFKVGEKEKGELLGALGGMKGDIVGR